MGCQRDDAGLAPEEVNMVVRGRKVDELGRSRTFKVLSCARPWSRAFHFSWLSFFLAFMGWFAIVPALEYLVEDPTNDIDKRARQTSNIISVAGTIFLRLAMGPMLERWGPRRIQSVLLTYGAVLVMCAALINSAASLYVVRFLIGFVGAAFVPCQFWTSMMHGQEVVGQANAFAGGWGNLGGGFTLVFVAALISGFQGVLPDDKAWRAAMVIPGALMLLVSIPMWIFSDDCPQGHWRKRLYRRTETASVDPENLKSPLVAKKKSIFEHDDFGPWIDWRVWLLFIQYACCFGVELAINNSMGSFLYQQFTVDETISGVDCKANPFDETDTFVASCSVLGKNTSSMIAALFGLQNLYARALGGLFSDRLNRTFFMRGRLTAQFICLLGEGIMLMIFSQLKSLGLAILFLILFSIFVQMSEGSTYSIVPFARTNVGAVAGIVGAGGNVGAVLWSTMFRELSDIRDGYLYLGVIVLCSAFLTVFLQVNGTMLFFGENKPLSADDTVSEAGSEDMSEDFTDSIERQTSSEFDVKSDVANNESSAQTKSPVSGPAGSSAMSQV